MMSADIRNALRCASVQLKDARSEADRYVARFWIDELLDRANRGRTHHEAYRAEFLLDDAKFDDD